MIFGRLKRYAIAAGLFVLGVLGVYLRGRSDEAADQEREDLETYREGRRDADNADLGFGATDAERIDRLRRFSRK